MAFRLRFVRGVAPVALALGLASLPVVAVDKPWQFVSVRGLVVYLQDGKWQEFDPNQSLAAGTLRTLHSGRVRIEGRNLEIDVGPNSALRFVLPGDGSPATIDQYQGHVTLSSVRADGPASLVLRAGNLTLAHVIGSIDVSMADNAVSVVVKSGSALATTGGKAVQLATGGYETDGSGILVATAAAPQMGPSTNAAANPAANGSAGPAGPASNNAGGSGNGSAGNGSNGNGGGNGAAGNGGGAGSGGGGNGNGSGGNNGGNNGGGGAGKGKSKN